MRVTSLCLITILAGCAAEPSTHVVDHSGARNAAFRAAAEHYGLSEDWLVALGYQQGRFEPGNAVDEGDDPAMADTPTDPGDPAWTLDVDTPVDETDPMPDNSLEGAGMPEVAPAWGVMYLTDAQVERAAALTGHDPAAIRTDTTANIDAAAALLADGWHHGSEADLRAATTAFLGVDVDPDAAELALHDLDGVLANGFDLTTEDGERLELTGTDPGAGDPADGVEPAGGDGLTAEARVAPGHYPKIQWIPSPNHSSRLGLKIHYIVIHDIEGTMAGAIAVFKNPAAEASAHYIVRARDGHIVRMVRESQNAWHAGHGWFNRHSIGIEHEGYAHRKKGGGYYTKRLYTASARLTCAIAHRYHIPLDRKHIFGHENVPSNLSSHKLCSDKRGDAGKCGGVSHHSDPGRYWNWKEYMHLVATCVRAAG